MKEAGEGEAGYTCSQYEKIRSEITDCSRKR